MVLFLCVVIIRQFTKNFREKYLLRKIKMRAFVSIYKALSKFWVVFTDHVLQVRGWSVLVRFFGSAEPIFLFLNVRREHPVLEIDWVRVSISGDFFEGFRIRVSVCSKIWV